MNENEKNMIEEEKTVDPIRGGEMKKKIVILVCLLLCVAALIVLVVLRAGIPMVDFWAVAGSVEPVDTKISSVSKIEALGGTRVHHEGVLAVYEKTDADGLKTQYVLNIESGTVVDTLSDTESVKHVVKPMLSASASWYSVEITAASAEQTLVSLSLRDAKGSIFAEKKDLSEEAYTSLTYKGVLDLVLLDREAFRADKNGTFKRAFTLHSFETLPAFEEKIGNYYYIEDGETHYVYDEDASLTATYRVPAAAENFQCFHLSDGSLLAQYVTAEGLYAEDFTYLENGEKYKLHHVLVSPKNGEKTVLEDIPLYIEYILSDDALLRALGMNTGIDNFVIGYPVQDGALEMNEYHQASLLLSNRGRVTSSVGNIIPAMQGGLVLGIAKNRWIVKNLAGEYYLLNEWGSEVGPFPADYRTATECAAQIFVYEEKIYDWNLNLLYDMKENGVLSHEMVGSSVLMYKEKGEAVLYDGRKKTTVAITAPESEKAVSVLGGVLISVKETVNGAVHYGMYNESGEVLADIEADAVVAYRHTLEDAVRIELVFTAGEETEIYLASVED